MSLDPRTESLLAVARDALRGELMPQLAGEARYVAAMVANAMAIALRSSQHQKTVSTVEEAALSAVYPEHADEPVDALRRRLIADIRRGRFDGAGERLTAHVLGPRVAARLAVSNPDYVGARGRTGLAHA